MRYLKKSVVHQLCSIIREKGREKDRFKNL
jgi:hypothetical protein